MASRILVTGKYLNSSTYVLYKQDGTVLMELKEGEGFRIANQLRWWYPVKVQKRNGHGTILVCRKFGDRGNIIEEFPLIHNKIGLWALTSAAARRGVFHRYQQPKSELQKQLAEMNVSSQIVQKVDKIDLQLEVGGQLCHHCTEPFGYGFSSDGKSEDLTVPRYAPQNHYNKYHRGCMVSTYMIRVFDATYIIYYHIGNGLFLKNILLTPQANEEEVVRTLKNIFG